MCACVCGCECVCVCAVHMHVRTCMCVYFSYMSLGTETFYYQQNAHHPSNAFPEIGVSLEVVCSWILSLMATWHYVNQQRINRRARSTYALLCELGTLSIPNQPGVKKVEKCP